MLTRHFLQFRFLQENRMDALKKLLDLDEKHNELLEQLAQLDDKISETLKDWVSGPANPVIPFSETIAHPTSRIKAA